MRLDEAYQRWGSESKNRELFKNTKDVFRKATWKLPTNQPCSYYTLPVLARAFAASTLAHSDKVNAASVMCHVLNYAHSVDPDNNPNPGFTFGDITDYGGSGTATDAYEEPEGKEESVQPADEPKDEPNQVQYPKGVVQLDLITHKVIKVWPTAHAAAKALGIQNIQRAIDRHGVSGGYFWCRHGEEKSFTPAPPRLVHKTKPKAEQEPTPAPSAEPITDPDAPDYWGSCLYRVPDEKLVKEIRRRGWKGQLIITKVIEFN